MQTRDTSAKASRRLRPPRAVSESIDKLEHASALDPVVRLLDPAAARLDAGPAGGVLRGDWLGHALHPMLTDLPIGCWTSSFVLDLVGGRRSRSASQRLIALGLLSVIPVAASGVVDWHQLPDQERRRVGVAHSASNSIAAVLYLLSWRARRAGHHMRGVALGAAGGLAATVGGHLGGHLAFARSAGAGERGVEPAEPDRHALDGKIGG